LTKALLGCTKKMALISVMADSTAVFAWIRTCVVIELAACGRSLVTFVQIVALISTIITLANWPHDVGKLLRIHWWPIESLISLRAAGDCGHNIAYGCRGRIRDSH
jgi:hypothetical protein